MIWLRIPVYASICFSAWVIIRLLSLHLHRVYLVFCGFLAFELLSGVVAAINAALGSPIDYRLLWVTLAPPEWILTLWTIYTLLDAVLDKLPGVLSFSKRLLRIVFLISAVVAFGIALALLKFNVIDASADMLAQAAAVGITLERTIGILALLVLIAILGFVLWFPVQMPRNLILFCSGLVVYFLFRTGSAFGDALLPPNQAAVISTASLIVLPACYVYWALSITLKGEKTIVAIGHGWSMGAQAQMIRELEDMNAALLRSGRR
jgi:hypothetical protein